MNDFVKFNKVTGVYWLKKPIDTLSIKIKTKLRDGIVRLPTFEQYNIPDTSNQKLIEGTPDVTTLKWQEKVFSRYEIEKYCNIHNCITDTELSYFELLENTQCEEKKIFTYIHEDFYRPLPWSYCNEKENKIVPYLNSCFGTLNLTMNEKFGRVFNNRSSSVTQLLKSKEDTSLQAEEWMSMHILYDNSQYREGSQVLLRQESVMLSIYYNTSKNYLILSPDVNDILFNPYTIDGDEYGLEYSVGISYREEKNSEEILNMLIKLYKKWEKKHRQLVNFNSPRLGQKLINITFEIVSAKGFETDNIYIEFHIKIPDNMICRGALHGKTHSTSALRTEGLEQWKYGHSVDLEMEISTGIEPSPIKIYLEVISSDWWGRHRTEGYTSLQVPVDPGCYSRTLTCSRPEEFDLVAAETRRFFVGGCHLIKDLGVLDNPSQSTNYRWTTTGSVDVRWSRLGQCAARGSPASAGGAEAALRRYRRAVATLAAARDLYTHGPD